MKKETISMLCGCLLISPAVIAENVGLGVSVTSNTRSVYLPIKIQESYWVEPFLSYYKDEYGNDVEEFGTSYKNNHSALNIGTGFFKSRTVNDSIGTYFGLRISYAKQKQGNAATGTYVSSSEVELTGFNFAPVVGFDYSIAQNLTVGFEAEWAFYNLSGKQKQDNGSPEHYIEKSTVKSNGQSTNTRVIVRYFF
jgi:hypothetical protein